MTEYEETIENVRAERDRKTASNPLHWLNLAGLFWLEEGENSFGSAKGNKIILSAFPHAFCGSFQYKDGLVTLHPAEDIKITVNGNAPETRPLAADRDKDLINIGSLTMKIIIRGGVPLVRIWDRESPAGKNLSR